MPESAKICLKPAEAATKAAERAENDAQRNVVLDITRQSMRLAEQARNCFQVAGLCREPEQAVGLSEVARAVAPQSVAELEQQNHALRLALSQLETDIQRLRRNLIADRQIPTWIKTSIGQIEMKVSMLASDQCDPARTFRMGLTTREEAVVTLASQALSNKVIGRRLGISAATVNSHLRSIYRKLGISNRATLVIMGKKGAQPRH